MSFDVFGLAQPILRAVVAEGYTVPTPIQSQAIPHVMTGRDLLGCAQTGTGKTAAFALPILHRLMQTSQPTPRGVRRIRTLVLSPTRELAAQIGDSFAAYGRHTGMRHTVVFGGVNQRPQVRDLQRGVDTLIATPGRLLDLINQGFIDLSTVEIFVLDEADRMLDMGFMPDIRRIIGRLPQKRQTLFFSATMPPEIERLANAILREPEQVRITPVKETAALIEQSVFFVPKADKPQLLTAFLSKPTITRALVFMRTKHSADRVVKQLNRAGIAAEAIHGNKSQAQRLRTLASFKSNRLRVLVATDLAARGIDVDGISHVVNFDLPVEAETYIHRIGRTGRAGATGAAVSFCAGDERKQLMLIQRLIGQKLTIEKELPAGATTVLQESAPLANESQSSGNQNGIHGGVRRSDSVRSDSSRSGYGRSGNAHGGPVKSGRKPSGPHPSWSGTGYRGGKRRVRAKSSAGR